MEFVEKLHWFDWTILSLFASGIGYGFRQGLTTMAIRTATYLLACYGSIGLHGSVAARLEGWFGRPMPTPAASGLGYSGAFIGSFVGVTLLFACGRKLSQSFLPKTANGDVQPLDKLGLRFLDRLAGAVVGMVLASFVAGTAVLGLGFIGNAQLEANLNGSQLRPAISREVEVVLAAVPQQYKDELTRTLDRLHHVGLDMAGEALGDGTHAVSGVLNNLVNQAQNNPSTLTDLDKSIARLSQAINGDAGNAQK